MCETQEKIGEKENIDQKTVSRILDVFRQSGTDAKMPNDFDPNLYDVCSL
jgi:hypothetical protein